MSQVKVLNKPSSIFFILSFVIILFAIAQPVFAEGVFLSKQKSGHKLSGADLNRIKAEHQVRFGAQTSKSAFNSDNPWDKKKQKNQPTAKTAGWGDCRDYALHKRNRCYREGRDAYRCEQMYETRARLCDASF